MDKLFSKHTKKYHQDEVLVGGYAPHPVAERFKLICLYHGISKSELLRQLITSVVNNDNEPDDEEILNEIASKAWREWETRLEANMGIRGWNSRSKIKDQFINFKKEVELNLQRKKISSYYIERILQKIGNIE